MASSSGSMYGNLRKIPSHKKLHQRRKPVHAIINKSTCQHAGPDSKDYLDAPLSRLGANTSTATTKTVLNQSFSLPSLHCLPTSQCPLAHGVPRDFFLSSMSLQPCQQQFGSPLETPEVLFKLSHQSFPEYDHATPTVDKSPSMGHLKQTSAASSGSLSGFLQHKFPATSQLGVRLEELALPPTTQSSSWPTTPTV